jgi:hypothetical protein
LEHRTFLLCIWLANTAWAQEPSAPKRTTELDRLKESCSGSGFAVIASCAEALFTGEPLHIAVGSLAPQNGFGAGGAFNMHWTPTNWRNAFDIDAVATPNGSWRAGAYLTMVWLRHPHIVVTTAGSGKKSNLFVREQPVFQVYGESTSLNKLGYFGLGPNTADTARSYFAMRETIAGASLVWPPWKPAKWRPLNLSLFGEANLRFVDLRGSPNQPSPSIEQIYTPATAPGLSSQPSYGQFGEGIGIRPSLAHDYINLSYSVALQEWVSSAQSAPSFRRLNVDLEHHFLLYKATRSLLPRDGNGPDNCADDPSDKTSHKCPPILVQPLPGRTRALEGSFNLILMIRETFSPAAASVPFYFQPTLGGADINGASTLPSYQDYRFRGPNTVLYRASFEHSVYNKWPLGVTAMVDEGKVALTHGDIDFSHLRHSYAVGLTLRAGGFPIVYLLFSWGGHEGTHTIVRADTSLLGAAARPSYY